MTDTQRASQIPVISPRATHTKFPSVAASPHLGLVTPSRYPSVSGSPTLPSPTSSPSSPSSNGSTPFRSFRNFLSFGVGSSKTASTPTASAIPKSHFSTLGTIRRSVNVERRASSPHLNPRRSEDDYVLKIDLPRPGDEGLDVRLPKSSDPPSIADSPTSQPTQSLLDSPSTASGTPALPASELSTILEADTSGISKHLPSLNSSQASDREFSPRPSPNPFQPQSLHPPRDTRHGSSSPSNDTSLLDLSTSKLTSEVLAALSETGDKQDWLNGGIVLDDAPSDRAVSRERTPESPDTSFHFNSLDPDLAALLSPNRAKGSTEPALLVAINTISTPSPSPPSSPTRRFPMSTISSPARSSAELPASTSMRRIHPTSLSAAPRLPSTVSSLPRITRSVSDRPAFGTPLSGPPSPITRTPSGRAMSSSPEHVASAGSSSTASRLARATPVDASASSSFRTPGSSGNVESRRTAASRLLTPSRPSSSSVSLSRPPLSRFSSSHTTSAWETESASLSSRPASSVGTAPSRLQHNRPSLDTERPRFAGSIRTRKRSTSVIENRVTQDISHAPPVPAPRSVTDWLGPRTAKAFAAAGLLDFEKDSPGSASRPSSRFGTSRSSIDRDSRSRYTPSRMAFSEAGSSSSWGARSGSISRAGGYSEGMSTPGLFSEAMSTPRTTFSSASTAPTSVSASSVQQEIQQLQDKHALETSALLGALADSQRTSKVLRDENAQLRDRIQMLEDKLVDAQERIQQILYSQPPPLAAKSVYSQRYGSPVLSDRRSLSHSRNNSFLRPRGDAPTYADLMTMSSPDPQSSSPETPVDNADGFVPSNRKRMSGTSSVFPSLPSNMSMIMHEDSVSPDAFAALSLGSSSPAGSPTMVYTRLHGGAMPSAIPKAPSSRAFSHRANRSVSSAGNISPTTANFSIMTSSPGSLNIRPEHERHLGDMPPLDLDADGFEFDGSALR
ncbi:hypothetical protein C8Q80DRAFT_1109154 [Daedaleopsis nitida]|nr:hypothetical protein C8Q80DRAFT_1109154 [Daedaleopsis nitida]